ncbi:MAG TPA: family 16 glycoside hydrolase, partial [Armatimonadota bacterium]|nr:family 16 glycoside hydrolase [Armatimonadota bacterium]
MPLILIALATTTFAQPARLFCSFDGMQGRESKAWLPLTDGWESWDGGYGFTDARRRGTASWLKNSCFSDVDITVRFRIDEVGKGVRAAGIAFRSQDSKTSYYVHIDSGNSQVILLRSEPAKTWNELQRVPRVTITRDEWHDARVTCIGSDIKFYLDGALTAQASDDTLTHGIVALRAGQGRMLFDNLAITGTRVAAEREWTLLPGTKPNDDMDRPMFAAAERSVAVRGG